MNRHFLFPAVILLTLLFLAGCHQDEPAEKTLARPIRAMKVGDIAQLGTRSLPGRARATQEVDLSFRVSGPLIARPVSVGDQVEAGALLARIDTRDFEVQLRNAEGQLGRAKANRERARRDYDRVVSIRSKDPGAISQSALDQAEEALELAVADIAALEASVDAARDALSYTHLKAPFAGTIVATYVENFEYVQARQPIARLLDASRIEFTVNVPESLISLVTLVEEIRVRFDVFPDLEIPAEVQEIGTEASETTRTYPVTLILDQPEGVRILPGMAGKVTAKSPKSGVAKSADTIVPLSAVFSPAQDQNYVWVIESEANTVSRREVRLGMPLSSGVVVEEGLAAGELIATAGVLFLTEGQAVRPIED